MDKNRFIYKIDVLEALKAKGYNSYTIRRDKIISEAAVQQIRKGEVVSWNVMAFLCEVLELDVGDIVTYKRLDNGEAIQIPKKKSRGRTQKKDESEIEEEKPVP